MRRRAKSLLAAGLLLFAANAVGAQESPRIVAVNYPLQYFTERLVSDDTDVVFPVPKSVDPSFWRPSVADISMIQSADLVLLNGAGFATWIDRVSLSRSKLVNTSANIKDQFIVTQSITHSHGDGGEHSHEGLASYLWLDPTLALSQARTIADALTARGLGNANDVAARLEGLEADFEALDVQARATAEALDGIPLIATHPRYQYFARRYGLSVSSVAWEPGSMPSDAEIAELRLLVEQKGAKVLIWEAAPPEGAFEITAALGLQNIVFAPLAHGVETGGFFEAYSDALTALSEASVQKD
ncbi:MAG: metal ABC transporter substrate-binding protein [Roseobacter sp.]